MAFLVEVSEGKGGVIISLPREAEIEATGRDRSCPRALQKLPCASEHCRPGLPHGRRTSSQERCTKAGSHCSRAEDVTTLETNDSLMRPGFASRTVLPSLSQTQLRLSPPAPH